MRPAVAEDKCRAAVVRKAGVEDAGFRVGSGQADRLDGRDGHGPEAAIPAQDAQRGAVESGGERRRIAGLGGLGTADDLAGFGVPEFPDDG